MSHMFPPKKILKQGVALHHGRANSLDLTCLRVAVRINVRKCPKYRPCDEADVF